MSEKELKQNDFTLSNDTNESLDTSEAVCTEKSENVGVHIRNYYNFGNSNINSNNNSNNGSNNNSNNNNNNGNNSSDGRSNKNQKDEKGGGSWDKKDIAKIILEVLALITAAVTGFFGYKTAVASSAEPQISTEDSDSEEMSELEFCCNAEREEVAGISYLKYEITVEPEVERYHVKPYPYLVHERRGEDIVFPLKNIFTQEEYTADIEGKCVLRQEESMESVGSYISEILGDRLQKSYRIETILVISYGSGKDNEDLRECYFLKDGKLSKPDFKICNQVLKTYQNEEKAYIDMSNWPKNKEEIRKLINSE